MAPAHSSQWAPREEQERDALASPSRSFFVSASVSSSFLLPASAPTLDDPTHDCSLRLPRSSSPASALPVRSQCLLLPLVLRRLDVVLELLGAVEVLLDFRADEVSQLGVLLVYESRHSSAERWEEVQRGRRTLVSHVEVV